MKLAASLNLLLIAAEWLCIAQSDVRSALHLTGNARAQYLSHARADASRFRSYTTLWWNAIQAPELAA
ncbi:hypothetical protein CCP3SC15_990012 [Gammaproteobacteria bacterium]